MAEQRILAEQDYMIGMKYKELATKYRVSINTIKSWKQRYGWERKKGAVKPKSMHTKNDNSHSNKDPIVMAHNELLTDRQILFVTYYLKDMNATKAYKKAYNCDYETAKTNGNRLLTKAHIKEEVVRLRDEMFVDSLLTPKAIIQKYMDIAFADITDFATWNNSGTHMRVKPHNEIDGSLVAEVSNNELGMKIKLPDRMKALEKLEKYMGLMSEEEKARVELLKSKVPNKDGIDPNAQITALADLINNPAPERVIDDD
jgi:phage terminase small subunit